jgi:hypothetical protein
MKFVGFQTHVIADATGFTRAHVRRILSSPAGEAYLAGLQKTALENGAALEALMRRTTEEVTTELSEALS